VEPTIGKIIEPISPRCSRKNFTTDDFVTLLHPAIFMDSDKMHLVLSFVDMFLFRFRVIWLNVLWNIATSDFYIHMGDFKSVRAENLLLASSFPLTLSPLNPAPLQRIDV
jgi:hypothetical protein